MDSISPNLQQEASQITWLWFVNLLFQRYVNLYFKWRRFLGTCFAYSPIYVTGAMSTLRESRREREHYRERRRSRSPDSTTDAIRDKQRRRKHDSSSDSESDSAVKRADKRKKKKREKNTDNYRRKYVVRLGVR